MALDFIIQDDPLPWDYDLAEGNLLPSGKRLLWTKDIAFTQKQVDGQERIFRENSLGGGEGIFLLVCRCIISFVLVFVLVGHMCKGHNGGFKKASISLRR